MSKKVDLDKVTLGDIAKWTRKHQMVLTLGPLDKPKKPEGTPTVADAPEPKPEGEKE